MLRRLSNAGYYGLIAELDGRIVGSVYLDEHADYWDALACCGCRETDEEKKKKRSL